MGFLGKYVYSFPAKYIQVLIFLCSLSVKLLYIPYFACG